ncbi:MAG: hypothetical protein VX481_10430 [Cyanobacteriota bacterium]|nr:hypothetical protein [Cyanobacteriota bacterium]
MNILAVMDDAYLNAELHQDSGAIHLALHLDLREMPAVACGIVDATCRRIAAMQVNPRGQVFEEGPVFLQSAVRTEQGRLLNRACLYQMDFDADLCPRMHVHPSGERLLVLTTVERFAVFSLTPPTIDSDLEPMVTILDPELCRHTSRLVYGVVIESFVQFSMQIPVNTTHRFLGRGSAQSFHPDEAAETSTTMVKGSSMMAQTAFWSAQPPYRQDCIDPAMR